MLVYPLVGEMMDNTLDMLVEYSKKGKIITRPIMREIINIVSLHKELDEYIWATVFKRLEESTAVYQFYNNTIVVDQSRFKDLYNHVKNGLKEYKCSAFERHMSANTMLYHILLHEVEHALQVKQSLNFDLCFENRLLAISLYTDNKILDLDEDDFILLYLGLGDEELSKGRRADEKLRNKYKNNAPFERLANINSVKDVISTLNLDKAKLHIIIDAFENSLISYYLSGYWQNGSGPTERYLRAYRNLNIVGSEYLFENDYNELLKETRNSSLEEKMTLGLNITRKEHIGMKDKYLS